MIQRVGDPVLLGERIPDYIGERDAPQTPDLERADGDGQQCVTTPQLPPGEKEAGVPI